MSTGKTQALLKQWRRAKQQPHAKCWLGVHVNYTRRGDIKDTFALVMRDTLVLRDKSGELSAPLDFVLNAACAQSNAHFERVCAEAREHVSAHHANASFVFVDEIQFCVREHLARLVALSDIVHVWVSGLECDYRGRYFEAVEWLREHTSASQRICLTRMCDTCKSQVATHDRLVADTDVGVDLVNATYVSECDNCFMLFF